VKLSPSQAKVISSMSLQADCALQDIAKECKLRPHVVRYVLSDLIRDGRARAFPIVNVHALGYTDYCVFLTLTSENKASRQRVLRFFSESERTAWVAELSGEYHYTVSIFARDVFEVDSYFRELAIAVPGIVVEKSVAIRILWTTFRWKYLSNHPSKVEYITRTKSTTIETLDQTDHSILRALAQDSLAPRTHQARIAGIPVTTLHHRVKGLQARGILLGTVCFIDMAYLGIHSFRLLIGAKNSSAKLTQALWDFSYKHQNIVGFVHCLAAWDYEINVEVRDPAELTAIHDCIEDTFGSNIRSIRTVTVLGSPKTQAYPFR
jgi:DNA-binding Lrp family transcriptional regulator